MRDYRQYQFWKDGSKLVGMVAKLKFAQEERFDCQSQVRRAVISFVANVAEGCGRKTHADFSHYIMIARGSIFECEAILLSIRDCPEFFAVHNVSLIEDCLQTCSQIIINLNRFIDSISQK